MITAVGSVTRLALADQVRQRLVERIMDRDLAPGARLNIDALAREMQVSATPLREALSALTARGLVLNQPYIGFSVAPMPDGAFLRDLYATRLRIEPWLAGLAAKSGSPQLVSRLSASLSDMGAHAVSGPWKVHRTHAVADEAFHDTIAEAAGNQPARQALAALNAQIHASRLYMVDQTGAADTAAEHRRILDAIAAADPVAAEAAMAAHLSGSLERFAP
jgi:DNA-binding GntR family transcriptional regulator